MLVYFNDLHTAYPTMDETDWDKATVPVMGDLPGVGSQPYSTYWNIASISEYPDDAMEVIKYLISDEYRSCCRWNWYQYSNASGKGTGSCSVSCSHGVQLDYSAYSKFLFRFTSITDWVCSTILRYSLGDTLATNLNFRLKWVILIYPTCSAMFVIFIFVSLSSRWASRMRRRWRYSLKLKPVFCLKIRLK